MNQVRTFLRNIFIAGLRSFGSAIRDAETGKTLGKALLLPWRGRIVVIGLESRVVPMFLSQEQATYWKQEIGFVTHPPPDFPNERGS